MIREFTDSGTEDIFNGKNTRDARRTCPGSLWHLATQKLDQLDSVGNLDDLRVPPGNRPKSLKGDRKGHFSIRINQQYRICFSWKDAGPADVEIIDYHD